MSPFAKSPSSPSPNLSSPSSSAGQRPSNNVPPSRSSRSPPASQHSQTAPASGPPASQRTPPTSEISLLQDGPASRDPLEGKPVIVRYERLYKGITKTIKKHCSSKSKSYLVCLTPLSVLQVLEKMRRDAQQGADVAEAEAEESRAEGSKAGRSEEMLVDRVSEADAGIGSVSSGGESQEANQDE